MADLVSYLKNLGVLKSSRLVGAFGRVDRRSFVPENFRRQSYEDRALPIGCGQTISQPYTVAFMLELLNIRKGQKILDVGSGSGWQSALLAEAVGREGEVWAVEIIPEVYKIGRRNLEKYNFSNLHCILADARGNFSGPEYFDRIVIAAASPDIPRNLVARLAESGRMVLPLGREECDIVVIEKHGSKLTIVERHSGFVFVPLV